MRQRIIKQQMQKYLIVRIIILIIEKKKGKKNWKNINMPTADSYSYAVVITRMHWLE